MPERDAAGGGWDVAVVGGGPAGCSAAIHLAQAGARVTLLEARAYPHDKLCGEFLSPECADLLNDLGVLAALRGLGPAVIETACLTASDGAVWESRLPGPALGLTRRALDQALALRAQSLGVELRTGATVTRIDGGLAAGFHLRVTGSGAPVVNARAVIAAHGRRSALDRALDRRFLRQPQPFVGLKTHLAGPPLPGRIELHGFAGGYCGLSEVERGTAPGGRAANLALLVREDVFRRVSGPGPERVPAFIRWMRAQNPRLEAWLSQAAPLEAPKAGPLAARWLSIAQVPFGPKRAVVNEILMAGDSAGLITPLAGDGIAMALRGGQMAADHLLGFLAGRQTAVQACQGYAADWRRRFGGRVRLGRWLQVFMLRPALLGFGLRLLNAAPGMGEFVVAHTREARAAREGRLMADTQPILGNTYVVPGAAPGANAVAAASLPAILSLATGVPGQGYTQTEIFDYLQHLFQRTRHARFIFTRAGVDRRYMAADREFYMQPQGTEARNNAYLARALPLGEETIARCLAGAGVTPAEVDDFFVVSCTGLDIPGLDLRLAGQMGMRADLRRTCVLGMGCYAAFPALHRAREAVAARPGRLALVLALELCSLHLQDDDSLENMVVSALFADGAAAALIGSADTVLPASGAPSGPRLVDAATYCDYTTFDHMAFHVTDHGFQMRLSAYVPDVLAANVEAFIDPLLARNGLARADIAFWGVHPGGSKILDYLQERLALDEAQMRYSRAVLRDYGNMSSPTILFVLDQIQRQGRPAPGDYGLLMAFGPGLTMEAAVIQW